MIGSPDASEKASDLSREQVTEFDEKPDYTVLHLSMMFLLGAIIMILTLFLVLIEDGEDPMSSDSSTPRIGRDEPGEAGEATPSENTET